MHDNVWVLVQLFNNALGLKNHTSVASYEVEMCEGTSGVHLFPVSTSHHIDPIDVPMNRRIIAVIMNGLLAAL